VHELEPKLIITIVHCQQHIKICIIVSRELVSIIRLGVTLHIYQTMASYHKKTISVVTAMRGLNFAFS